jgi:uncharacterized membrane protein YeaQ/YmgE (transglycosylase-associated protein family)
MSIIAWIILGLLAGLIAEYLTGRHTGLILAMVVGIVGALLGGFLARAIFGVNSLDSFFDLSTWLTAIVGAVLLLLIVRAVTGRRRAL